MVKDELSISVEIKSEKDAVETPYTRREFTIGSFKRSFTLPETVNEEGIKAKYYEGILSVEIPKKEEAKPKAPRTIEIS